jgi:hypothetical protein
LGSQWWDWLEGLTITPGEDGNTLLTGPVVGDAASHSLIKKVRDVGMPLLLVNRVEPGPSTTTGTDQADAPDVKQQIEVSCLERRAAFEPPFLAYFSPWEQNDDHNSSPTQ